MAVQGPIPVEFGQVFPRGVFAAGGFEPVRDFDASKAGGRFVQSKDKATGLPLWQVDVIDGDPAARDKSAGLLAEGHRRPRDPHRPRRPGTGKRGISAAAVEQVAAGNGPGTGVA